MRRALTWKLFKPFREGFDTAIYGPDAEPNHDSDDTAYRDRIALVRSADDAPLIAAAPALYEALKVLDGYYNASGDRWDAARDALALVENP